MASRRVAKTRWAAAIVSVFLGAILLLVGVFNISSGTVGNLINYAVVIDAGSSHTSTFLYKLTWLEDDSFNTSSKIEQVFDCTFDKGVAEFVENDAIKNMLKDLAIDYVQGYGIGKPIPLNELANERDNYNLVSNY